MSIYLIIYFIYLFIFLFIYLFKSPCSVTAITIVCYTVPAPLSSHSDIPPASPPPQTAQRLPQDKGRGINIMKNNMLVTVFHLRVMLFRSYCACVLNVCNRVVFIFYLM